MLFLRCLFCATAFLYLGNLLAQPAVVAQFITLSWPACSRSTPHAARIAVGNGLRPPRVGSPPEEAHCDSDEGDAYQAEMPIVCISNQRAKVRGINPRIVVGRGEERC